MVVSGKVVNGQIRLDEPLEIPEGSRVRVVAIDAGEEPIPGSPDAIARYLESRLPMTTDEAAEWKDAMAEVETQRRMDAQSLADRWEDEQDDHMER